jgi:hypothetical protein
LSLMTEVNGTAVLHIGDPGPFDRHFAFTTHGQIGLTKDLVSLECVGGLQ